MKPSIYRRIRRRPASSEATSFKKDNQPEQQFFGETTHEPFFKPAAANAPAETVQRECAGCETEDKVQRVADKKEEEKKVQRATDKKEEEKVKRMADKKEEDKVQRSAEKKEEEKPMKKEEKEEEKLHKKEATTPTANTPTTASNYISSINGKGQSMDAGVQSFYENRMGADFSDVKIHTGKEASESTTDINAQAYAYGNHIVFNEGKYQPQSGEGKHLLAHELAHVAQQGNSIGEKVQRTIRHHDPDWATVHTLPYTDSATLRPGAWYTDAFRRPPAGTVHITVSTSHTTGPCHEGNHFGVDVYQRHITVPDSIEKNQHTALMGHTINYSITLPSAELTTYEEFSLRIFVNCSTDVSISITA